MRVEEGEGEGEGGGEGGGGGKGDFESTAYASTEPLVFFCRGNTRHKSTRVLPRPFS